MTEYNEQDVENNRLRNEEVLETVKDGLNMLIKEKESTDERLGFFSNLPEESFLSYSADKPYETMSEYARLQKNATIAVMNSESVKLQGKIQAQVELIHKLSEAGEQEQKASLDMIEANQQMKSEIEVLKVELEESRKAKEEQK